MMYLNTQPIKYEKINKVKKDIKKSIMINPS